MFSDLKQHTVCFSLIYISISGKQRITTYYHHSATSFQILLVSLLNLECFPLAIKCSGLEMMRVTSAHDSLSSSPTAPPKCKVSRKCEPPTCPGGRELRAFGKTTSDCHARSTKPHCSKSIVFRPRNVP